MAELGDFQDELDLEPVHKAQEIIAERKLKLLKSARNKMVDDFVEACHRPRVEAAQSFGGSMTCSNKDSARKPLR